ncbi:hypothetical protein ACFX2A_044256 [Malus domestica]
MRKALVNALMNPYSYSSKACKVGDVELRPHKCVMCYATCAAINFTDKDLLLGSKPHNRPLFVSGYTRE